MTRLYCVVTVLLLLGGIVSCVNKEQVYQGMYQGFSTVDETRMTQDPSYDPIQARDKDTPGYQEYKRDREMILNENAAPVSENEI